MMKTAKAGQGGRGEEKGKRRGEVAAKKTKKKG